MSSIVLEEQIPPGVGVPEMGQNTSGLGQVFQYMLRTNESSQYDTMALRSLNDWVIKLLLMPVDGVTNVLSFGGEIRQYQVQLNPKKLLSYDITVDAVTTAIEANNRNAGGWYMDRGAEQLVIRGVGWVRSGEEGLRDIANISVKDTDGVVIRVRESQMLYLGLKSGRALCR
ncbi:MAG: efflux RND transporter permease subunit [Gammaproteobacteria bacterium]|nr:efflux RND transporter permease subunit [Gammaproteobacteria bacterium]